MLWLALPCVWSGLALGLAKASLLFLSDFTIPVAQRLPVAASWNGRTAVSCGMGHWHVGLPSRLQDLLGRPVGTRHDGRSSTFVDEHFCIFFVILLTHLGQVFGIGVGGTIGI